MSESPAGKRGKNSLSSNKGSRKKYTEELDRKSQHTRKNTDRKEQFDFQDDSFSMTYSEEEFKDTKKKCQIS